MFPEGLLVSLTCYILLIINWVDLSNIVSFSVSPGNFSILKILWNYHQEFIKASGGWPVRRFHILKYCKSENKRFIVIFFLLDC